jgi:cardiolipin synthase A/B
MVAVIRCKGPCPMFTTLLVLSLYLVQLVIVVRVLLRTGLEPTVRLSWIMVIGLVPALGMLLYFLFGEIRMASAKTRLMTDVRARLAAGREDTPDVLGHVQGLAIAPFATGQATSGFAPVTGNRAWMLPEGDAQFDDLIAGIDAATDHVHILFYIWLPDATGSRVAEAVMRAAGRGVAVRVLVDDLGSRAFVRSPLWTRMRDAGVRIEKAFPFGNPFISMLFQRIDLRNHRKIVVIDNRVTWCGSRNCANAAFEIKAKYAPWVDILLRFEGPIVRQNQAVFLQDWMLYCKEDLTGMLDGGPPPISGGFTAQVIATGPDQSRTGLSDTMCAMIYGATAKVTVTTPYYVPDLQTQAALTAAALRGVATTIILPMRNDSQVVGSASESHYHDLLSAGVRLMGYKPGLLHAKILTVDGRLSLIGSTNMDRRSFNLNYENGILIDDPSITCELDTRQDAYIALSHRFALQEVNSWSYLRRIRNNSVALAEPLL